MSMPPASSKKQSEMHRKDTFAHDADHHRRFQIDRIALFSDAVFAIAITLLIIEVKVPHVTSPATDEKILEKMLEMIPEFVGFFISFFVIGLYWLVHHRMFGYVVNFNRKLLVNNMFFLLTIVLMPFSSAFFSDYFITFTKVPMAFYFGNICLSGLMSYRLWKILSKPGNVLTQGLENKVLVQYYLLRSMLVPIAFTTIFLFSFVFNQFAFYITMLMPFMNRGVSAYYRKKHPEIFTD